MITGPIRHAMISLGLPGNDVFDRQEPFIWNVEGGVCHFQGSCAINPGSSITLRKGAYLSFGERVSMGQHTKIICYKKIVIGQRSTILKGAFLPNYSSLASNSLLNKKMVDQFALYGGIPARLVKKNIARIINERDIQEGIKILQQNYNNK